MTEQQATETPGEDTSTEIPGGDPQEIEPDDSTDQSAGVEADGAKLRREAARYRRSLREAETARDSLRGQLETMQRAEVERLAAEHLATPTDLWLTGTALPDLVADNGNVDPAKVNDTTKQILTDRPGWRRQSASFDGGVRATAPNTGPTWHDALRP